MLPGSIATDSDVVAELLAQAFPETDDLAGALQAVLPIVEGAFSFVLMDAERLYGVRDPHGFRPLCLGRLGPADAPAGWVLASETPALERHRGHLRARDRARRAGRDRRRRGAQPASPVAQGGRPPAVHLRVRLHRPARQPPLRARGARDAVPHGRAAGRAGAGGGRHGDGRARVGRARRRGLRPGQRHPLRPGPGQEPLHRPLLHRARPAGTGRRRAAQAQPAERDHRRQAPGGGGRLHRARHHAALGGPHAARGGRGRGAPAHLVAAVALALLLRHRHARPTKSCWPHHTVEEICASSGRTRWPTSAWRTSSGPSASTAGFCDACFTGHYPTAVPPWPPRSPCADPSPDVAYQAVCPGSEQRGARAAATYAGAGVDIGAGDAAVERACRAWWPASAASAASSPST